MSTSIIRRRPLRVRGKSLKEKFVYVRVQTMSVQETWNVLKQDLTFFLKAEVAALSEKEKSVIRSALRARKNGQIFPRFIHKCVESSFEKLEDHFGIESYFFEKFYDDFSNFGNALLDDVFAAESNTDLINDEYVDDVE